MRATKRRRRHAAGLVVGASLLAAGCGRGRPQAGAPPPAQVLVLEAIQEVVPIYREWVGTLDGSSNAHIRARVEGYLEAIRYQEGSLVRTGDLLFEIDPRPYQAALDQAIGQEAQAEAELGQTELSVQRLRPLAETEAISQQEFDDALQSNLSAKARVASARAAVDAAQINMGYTRVTAPIDGVAGMAQAQVGDLVSAGLTLTTVSTIDPIRAYFSISEQEYLERAAERIEALEGVPLAQRPARLELITADGHLHPHRGRFSFADRQVDPETGTLRIVALFPNPERRLRPGQFVRVHMMTESRPSVLVPQRAVIELQGTYRVQVVTDDDRIEDRPVTPGERVDTWWTIEKGLRQGERVVVEGHDKVHPGDRVAPRPFPAEPLRHVRPGDPAGVGE